MKYKLSKTELNKVAEAHNITLKVAQEIIDKINSSGADVEASLYGEIQYWKRQEEFRFRTKNANKAYTQLGRWLEAAFIICINEQDYVTLDDTDEDCISLRLASEADTSVVFDIHPHMIESFEVKSDVKGLVGHVKLNEALRKEDTVIEMRRLFVEQYGMAGDVQQVEGKSDG